MIHPERILFVDDEPLVLAGLQRQLRTDYTILTAEGAEAGLKMMADQGPFAVVVSDMRMPRISGVQFLEQVRQEWPETIRMMLTGNADQETAIDAVNRGQIHRFLNKPCPKDNLQLALDSALAQYRLVRTERELLSETLNGSISLLSEVLAIQSPLAFGRIAGIRRLADQASLSLPTTDQWEISAAAMLAFIGCITLDETTLTRYFQGQRLEPIEQKAVASHPDAGGRLIARIPRLRGVAEIVRRQNETFQVTAVRADADGLGLCANILKVAIDFDWKTMHGKSGVEALVELRNQPQVYNPAVLKIFGDFATTENERRDININQLIDGMILDEPLVSIRGDLLLAAGNVVGPAMRERLLNIDASPMGVRQPFRVRVR